jgi:hypothetical protein
MSRRSEVRNQEKKKATGPERPPGQARGGAALRHRSEGRSGPLSARALQLGRQRTPRSSHPQRDESARLRAAEGENTRIK